MIRLVLLIVSFLLLAGCLTEKKVVRQVAKGYAHHPETVAGLTAKWFPVRTVSSIETEFIKGKDSVVYQTDTVVFCDTVGQKISIPKGREVYRTDTYKEKRVDSVENTAALEALRLQFSKYEAQVQKILEKNSKLEEQLKEGRSLNRKMSVLLVAVVVLSVLLFKLKMF